jgi:hypothetical protein
MFPELKLELILLLNVFQSVELSAPAVVLLAVAMVIFGVAPPLLERGADAVTPVTVPALVLSAVHAPLI